MSRRRRLGRVSTASVPGGHRRHRGQAVQRAREQRRGGSPGDCHVHFHIIPKPNAVEGLGVGWPQQAFDHKAGAELAAKLRAAIALDNP